VKCSALLSQRRPREGSSDTSDLPKSGSTIVRLFAPKRRLKRVLVGGPSLVPQFFFAGQKRRPWRASGGGPWAQIKRLDGQELFHQPDLRLMESTESTKSPKSPKADDRLKLQLDRRLLQLERRLVELANKINIGNGQVKTQNYQKLHFSSSHLLADLVQVTKVDDVPTKLDTLDTIVSWAKLNCNSDTPTSDATLIWDSLLVNWDNDLQPVRRKCAVIAPTLIQLLCNCENGRAVVIHGANYIWNDALDKVGLLGIVLAIVPIHECFTHNVTQMIITLIRNAKLNPRNVPRNCQLIVSLINSQPKLRVAELFKQSIFAEFEMDERFIEMLSDKLLPKIVPENAALLAAIQPQLLSDSLETRNAAMACMLLIKAAAPCGTNIDDLIVAAAKHPLPQLKYLAWSLAKPKLAKFIEAEGDVNMFLFDRTTKFLVKTLPTLNHDKRILECVGKKWIRPSVDPKRNLVGLKLLNSLKPTQLDPDSINNLMAILSRNLLGVNRSLARDILLASPQVAHAINLEKWTQFARFLVCHARSLERSRGASLFSLLTHHDPSLIPAIIAQIQMFLDGDVEDVGPAMHGYLLALAESSVDKSNDSTILTLAEHLVTNAISFFEEVDTVLEGYDSDEEEEAYVKCGKNRRGILVGIYWRSIMLASKLLVTIHARTDGDLQRTVALVESGLISVRHQGVSYALEGCYERLLRLYFARNANVAERMVDRVVKYVHGRGVERLDERYQGISRCFIALMRCAPPPLVEKVKCMLFDAVAKERGDAKLNLLHVLMCVYKDSELGHLFSLERGFGVIMDAMCDESSTVRNAGLTWWARAWAARVFGDECILKWNLVGAHDFAKRYPSVLERVVAELETCVREERFTMPTFFPMLCMLSRLKTIDPSPLPVLSHAKRLVMQVLSRCKIALVQDLSAVAFWALIPPSHHDSAVGELISALDSETTGMGRLGFVKALRRFGYYGYKVEADVGRKVVEACVQVCETANAFVTAIALEAIRLFSQPLPIVTFKERSVDAGQDLLDYEQGRLCGEDAVEFGFERLDRPWFVSGVLDGVSSPSQKTSQFLIRRVESGMDGKVIVSALNCLLRAVGAVDVEGVLPLVNHHNVEVKDAAINLLTKASPSSQHPLVCDTFATLLNESLEKSTSVAVVRGLIVMNPPLTAELAKVLMPLLLEEDPVRRMACRLVSSIFNLPFDVDSSNCLSLLADSQVASACQDVVVEKILKQNRAVADDVGIGEADLVEAAQVLRVTPRAKRVETLNEEQKEVWNMCPLNIKFHDRTFAVDFVSL